MARPRLPLNALGSISVSECPKGSGRYRALAHYRRPNGTIGQMQRTCSSPAKAKIALQKAFGDLDTSGGGVISPDMRMSKLADLFIAEKTARRSPGTVQTYQVAIDAHVKPGLGDLSIREAGTPARIDSFIVDIAKTRGHGAAKNCRSVLSGMMAMAVRNGALERNPVGEVEPIEKPRKPGSKPLPPEQLGKFLTALDGDVRMKSDANLPDLFKVMAGTGMRMGETLGLTWEAIDFGAGTIEVVRQAKYLKGRGAVLQDFTKTHASMRRITVPKAVMDVLRERKARAIPNDLRLVFVSANAGVLDPNNAERALRERRDAMGFPGITSHSLRKCVATMLDAAGMSPRAIADYLGHSRPSMTMDVYMQRSRSTAESAKSIQDVVKGFM